MHILAVETLIGFLVTSAISVGLSFLAYLLSKPKAQRFNFDNTPTTLTERGSYVPLLNGASRLGYIFAWAGDRKTKKKKRGGNSIFGGGTTTYTYYEAGWHAICIGPADALYRIRQNEKIIFEGPIIRKNPEGEVVVPSGSEFECDDDEGTFKIYWGDCHQPIDAYLAKQLGAAAGVDRINSRWPHVCYILWKYKKLGPSPVWPQLDYDVRVDTNNVNPSFPEMNTYLAPSDPEIGDEGVNPGIWLWQLMTGAFPHGCGLDPAMIDETGVEAIAATAADEHLPINHLVANGQEAGETIADLMLEVGFAMPQVGDKLTPAMIRPVEDSGTLPIIRRDLQLDLDPEEEKQFGDFNADRLIFTVRDRNNSFKDTDMVLRDDGQVTRRNRQQNKTVKLQCVADKLTAAKVAQRREVEFMLKGSAYKLNTTRGARLLVPGQAFLVEGVGQLRCMSVQPSFDSSRCVVEAMLDLYSLNSSFYVPPDVGQGGYGGAGTGPAPDPHVKPIIVPDALSPDPDKIVLAVLRIRANNQIARAAVWLSNGSSYVEAGEQDTPVAGGTLNSPLDVAAGPDVEIGPSITAFNEDIEAALDLTGNATAYEAGDQLLVIDDEIMLLERVEAVSGGWQLQGIRRGMYGTVAAMHATGSVAYIVTTADISPVLHAMLVTGATINIKTQPGTSSSLVSLGAVTPVSLVVP